MVRYPLRQSHLYWKSHQVYGAFVAIVVSQLAGIVWVGVIYARLNGYSNDPDGSLHWDATALARTFPPLIAACIIYARSKPAFGEIEILSSENRRLILLMTYLLTCGVLCLTPMLLSHSLLVGGIIMRNFLAFSGICFLLSRFLPSAPVWVLMLPGWSFIFVWQSTMEIYTWPNQLFAWPLADLRISISLLVSFIWIAVFVHGLGSDVRS